MSKKDLNQHVGHLFRVINNGVSRYFAYCNLDSYGYKLTMAQSSIMFFLYDNKEKDVFQKDIEHEFQISGATASNTLKGMEKQGVIERIPLDDDGRKKKIILTERGTQFHEDAIANLQRLEQLLVKGMTEEEITTYRGLLQRTLQNLDDFVPACSTKKNNKK